MVDGARLRRHSPIHGREGSADSKRLSEEHGRQYSCGKWEIVGVKEKMEARHQRIKSAVRRHMTSPWASRLPM
jgi:hypothetical protein